MAGATPRPFTLRVADDVLTDLKARLTRARFPDEVPGAGWRYGSDLAYMKELVTYWRARYDWRRHEARLNRLRQFTVPLGGIDLHFIHELGVGPRPLPLRDVQKFEEAWLKRRFSVKPGITCLWQVKGRNDTDFDAWIAQDLEYIDHWSFGLDLKILVKTIPAVLRGNGAY